MQGKYTETRNAVEALQNCYAEAIRVVDDLRKAKERLSAAAFEKYADTAAHEFAHVMRDTREKLSAAKKAAHARADALKCSYATVGDAEEDYKLLQLPVTLSADELRTLAQRHNGDVLFLRAVSEYAQRKGYTDAKDLTALQYEKTEYDKAKERASTLEQLLDRVAPSFDDVNRVAAQAVKGHCLAGYVANGLFDDK